MTDTPDPQTSAVSGSAQESENTEPAGRAPTTPRVTEVRAIADTLWFLPPPGRMMIADKLHGLGLRTHPELATMALEREGPVQLGNHAPQRVVKKSSLNEGMAALRQINPALAARIDAARADPSMAERIAAATTAGAQEAIARDLGIDINADIATINEHIANMPTPPPAAEDTDDSGTAQS